MQKEKDAGKELLPLTTEDVKDQPAVNPQGFTRKPKNPLSNFDPTLADPRGMPDETPTQITAPVTSPYDEGGLPGVSSGEYGPFSPVEQEIRNARKDFGNKLRSATAERVPQTEEDEQAYQKLKNDPKVPRQYGVPLYRDIFSQQQAMQGMAPETPDQVNSWAQEMGMQAKGNTSDVDLMLQYLQSEYPEQAPDAGDAQDMLEESLAKNGYDKVMRFLLDDRLRKIEAQRLTMLEGLKSKPRL